jgi:hypothetical protein
MIDEEILRSIASQLVTKSSVTVEGNSAPVRRTSTQHLKTAAFTVDGHEYQAIEQNPEKPSRWGQLARSGHQVVQFKDAERNKFVAVVVDDKVTFYGGSKEQR